MPPPGRLCGALQCDQA